MFDTNSSVRILLSRAMHGMYMRNAFDTSNRHSHEVFLTIVPLLYTIDANLRYILDTVAESDIEEERWKGVTTLQLLTRSGK